MSRLTEDQRATLAAELIQKAIRAEQRLCSNSKDDMYHRGRIAGLRSAYIFITGKTVRGVEASAIEEVTNLPVKKKTWDFPVRKESLKRARE